MKQYVVGLFAVVVCRVLTAAPITVSLTGFEDNNINPSLGGEGLQEGSAVEVVAESPHSGRRSARWTVVFREGVTPRQYVEMAFGTELTGDVSRISAWLYGDGVGQTLKMRVWDSSGEIHQLRGPAVDWTGWRQVTFAMDGPVEVYWGGDGNGRLDMPVRRFSLLLDSLVEPYGGKLYVDDLSYTTAAEKRDFLQLAITSDVPGLAFYGRGPELDLVVRNVLAETMETGAQATITDAWGQEVITIDHPLTLAPESSRTLSLRPQLPDWGHYTIDVSLSNGRQQSFAVSYLPRADAQEADPESPFGVSMHFGHGSRGPIEANLRLASDLGIRWLRDDAGWQHIEREKGQYRVGDTFDRFLRNARRQWGCEPLIILDYSNTLYEDNRSVETDAGREAFANWAEYMARTYRDTVRYWEVWNEPNIPGFWKPEPNPVAYAKLLKATYAAVKRGNPDAVVVAMATAGIDYDFIEAVLAQHTIGHFDAISVHPYRYPKAPEADETMVAAFRRLIDLLDDVGIGDCPIFNTEVGWPNHTGPRGLPEQTSADYLSRMYLLLSQFPTVKATFWYDFQNDGLDPEYNENNFGLLHHDFSPKAPAVAYRMTSMVLENRRFTRILDTVQGIRALTFAGTDGTTAVAAWSIGGAGGLTLRWEDDSVALVSAAGPMSTATLDDGLLSLELSETPVFIIGRAEPQVLQPTVRVNDLWGCPGDTVGTAAVLTNHWDRDLAVILEVDAPEGWDVRWRPDQTVPAGGSRHVGLMLTIPSAQEADRDQGIRLRWRAPEGALLGTAGGQVHVAPVATMHVHAARRNGRFGVAVSARTPLPRPPAAETLALTWPNGGRTALGTHGLGWQPVADELDVETPAWAITRCTADAFLPIPAHDVSPGPAPLEAVLVLAGERTVTAVTEIGFWRVPEGAVVVDAAGGDWDDIAAVPLNHFDGPEPAAWSGPQDLSATVSLARRAAGLAVLVRVTDDIHDQPYGGANAWKGDGVQIAFDLHAESRPSDQPFTELGLTLTKDGPEIFRWTEPAGPVATVQLAVERTGAQTIYEALIPWDVIGGTPAPGTILGFAMLVNDKDNREREGWLRLYDGIGWRKEPERFGRLFF